MTPDQLKSALAAAALRLSRTTPGVMPEVIHIAALEGAELALQFAAAVDQFEREELGRQRDAANLPN
ncbi:MAG: hypothetical protein RIQ93_2486 [Verrucomicrobiota bacterium]|jgi:hypothetical protein